MKTSPEGRKRITEREGLRLRAYKDSVGVWTVGVGHTSMAGLPKVIPGLVITKAQADEILSRDLEQFEGAVNLAVKVPLSQGQFDALVSLAFNIGSGGFRKSTVVRRLNEGNYRGAADAFLLWNKPPEIMGRRRSERAQFLSATTEGHPGQPVRFMPAPDLHKGETVTADYLRASGSRIVKGADTIQRGVQTLSGAAVAASAVASHVSNIHDGVASIGQAASDAKDMASWLHSFWPLLIVGGLLVVMAFAVWRIWRASHMVLAARVEDAAYTPQDARDA